MTDLIFEPLPSDELIRWPNDEVHEFFWEKCEQEFEGDEAGPLSKSSWFIAGGAPSSLLGKEQPRDFDVYFEHPLTEEHEKLLKPHAYETPWAWTHHRSCCAIQCIRIVHGKPSEVVSSFDFAHSQIWLTRAGIPMGTAETLECIRIKRLVYKGSLYPLKALWRMRKFLERGFWIDQDDYDHLIEDCKSVGVAMGSAEDLELKLCSMQSQLGTDS